MIRTTRILLVILFTVIVVYTALPFTGRDILPNPIAQSRAKAKPKAESDTHLATPPITEVEAGVGAAAGASTGGATNDGETSSTPTSEMASKEDSLLDKVKAMKPSLPYSLMSSGKDQGDPELKLDTSVATQARIKDTQNSTLGFEKVYVINLPERSDKLDAFTIAASLTGFMAEVEPGVKGDTVLDKSLPSVEGLPEKKSERNTVVGCWRAHLNFARRYKLRFRADIWPENVADGDYRLITHNIQSAVVLEDDADWDIHLKSQLAALAQGSQYVTKTTTSSRRRGAPLSPYGDNWDLIWLGNCGSAINPTNDTHRFIIENDITVPAKAEHIVAFSGDRTDLQKEGLKPEDHARLIYRGGEGLCTYSYALSLRGAKKLLRDQTVMKKFMPIDLGLGRICSDPSGDFVCVGITPTIIDSHKGAGATNKDSDMAFVGLGWNDSGNEKISPTASDGAPVASPLGAAAAPTPDTKPVQVRPVGYSFNIAYSTRLNIDKLLRGETVDFKSWRQWEDERDQAFLVDGPMRVRTVVREPNQAI